MIRFKLDRFVETELKFLEKIHIFLLAPLMGDGSETAVTTLGHVLAAGMTPCPVPRYPRSRVSCWDPRRSDGL